MGPCQYSAPAIGAKLKFREEQAHIKQRDARTADQRDSQAQLALVAATGTTQFVSAARREQAAALPVFGRVFVRVVVQLQNAEVLAHNRVCATKFISDFKQRLSRAYPARRVEFL